MGRGTRLTQHLPTYPRPTWVFPEPNQNRLAAHRDLTRRPHCPPGGGEGCSLLASSLRSNILSGPPKHPGDHEAEGTGGGFLE